MSGRCRLIVLLGVLLTVSCAYDIGLRTTTWAEEGVDFSQFETFAQVPPPEGIRVARERIEREISTILGTRGLREVPEDRADLLVIFRGGVEVESRKVDAGDPDANFTRVEEYLEGGLSIDFFDVRDGGGKRIWSGNSRAEIREVDDLEEVAARAVEAILAQLPIGYTSDAHEQ